MSNTTAPPSYEDAVNNFNRLVGSNNTAATIFEAAKGLSQADIDVLIENHEAQFPLKTEEDKVKFAEGMVLASSDPELQEYLELGALAASSSLVQIHTKFETVADRLALVDNSFSTSWTSQFGTIKGNFQAAVDGTRTLASQLGTTLKRFDTLDIKTCMNEDKPTEDRLRIATNAEAAFKGYEETTASIQRASQEAADGVKTFNAAFIAWAEDKEGELTDQIRNLITEINGLQRQLGEKQAQLKALTHASEGIVGLTGPLALAYPPYGALVQLGGLLIAGKILAITTALTLDIGRLESQIKVKSGEKEQLEADLEKVRAAKEAVEDSNDDEVPALWSATGMLTESGPTALEQSQELVSWLQGGAKLAARPTYLNLYAEGARSFNSIGKYLQSFGTGINAICSPSAQINE